MSFFTTKLTTTQTSYSTFLREFLTISLLSTFGTCWKEGISSTLQNTNKCTDAVHPQSYKYKPRESWLHIVIRNRYLLYDNTVGNIFSGVQMYQHLHKTLSITICLLKNMLQILLYRTYLIRHLYNLPKLELHSFKNLYHSTIIGEHRLYFIQSTI